MDESSFVTRDTMSIVTLMRALPSAAHRAFAHFVSEFWTDDQYFAKLREVDLREAAAAEASTVQVIPHLKVVQ
jgi:hypothetical protein